MIDGPFLRQMRERAGYNATTFAKEMGISLTYLGDIESGRRKLKRNPELISRFAAKLDIPRAKLEVR